MPPLEPTLLVDCKNLLGECALWNVNNQRLYWTDVYDNKLYSCDEHGKNLVVRELHDLLGSFAFDPDGNLLAAFSDGLFRYNLETDQCDRLTTFEPDLEPTRLNDGRCDRSGRFIVGGCHQGFYNPVSSVVSYSGGPETRQIIDKVALTNGIAFSINGSRMYFSDSQTQIIEWFDYDNATGQLGERHLFKEIPEANGFADGSCVDANDNLWNARYYGGIVQQYYPNGDEGIRINMPTDCPTCICFGGANMDTLFITTANKDIEEAKLKNQPHAGGLFKVKLSVNGLQESEFSKKLFK